MTTFWILWIFNALMCLIPVYYFFIGLGDGTITSRNIGLWFLILLVVAIILVGSFLLKTANQMALAKVILMIAAIPGILALLYFIIVFTSKPNWR
ncbi:MAG: osmoprotectant transporter permease [Saprospiraceae bacterium]|uniref:Osmoprotectant transporter permease n=1 Tax=Candidatus Opimibacter skivensis TaxID=2982028 RepID=A0A9D7STS1_9BACT|nr:osmoprotectant transporter permease [Candidatus Opimibacter skivensis]